MLSQQKWLYLLHLEDTTHNICNLCKWVNWHRKSESHLDFSIQSIECSSHYPSCILIKLLCKPALVIYLKTYVYLNDSALMRLIIIYTRL